MTWMDVWPVFLRLAAAVALGGAVAWIHRRTSPPVVDSGPTLTVTLVLLAGLIAMVTQVVGDNVARAFSLVGALSIVRFRTVVRDTRDTAFVIFSVVVGMAMGAQAAVVALAGLVVLGATAFVLARRSFALPGDGEGVVLTVRAALGLDLEQAAGELLDRHLTARQIQEIRTAKLGALLDYVLVARPKPDGALEELVKSLHRVEGIQEVRLRRRGEDKDE